MTMLAERIRDDNTQLLDELAPTLIGTGFRVEAVEPTGGADYSALNHLGLSEKLSQHWSERARRMLVVIPHQLRYETKLESPELTDSTWSMSAPSFVTGRGTGGSISEYLRSVWDEPRTLLEVEPSPAVLDIPTTLQQARAKAGLPVQDLAAMFGFKRRHFYNLMSGEVTTDLTSERHIARAAEAISRLSEQANGNSKSVRSALLARLDSDSVYDAAVAGDADRLIAATDRAVEALGAGIRRDRLAPSQQASSSEAAEVRDFLSASRDDTGARSDS